MARNVIYCEKDGIFEFYGSPTALSEIHPPEELGINNRSLNNAFVKLRALDKPLEFHTKTGFIIRKGEIKLSRQTTKANNHLGKK